AVGIQSRSRTLEGGTQQWLVPCDCRGHRVPAGGGWLLPLPVATLNTLHRRSTHDGMVDLGRLADAIRSLDADVLALQEVDRDQPRSHLADLTAVGAEGMGAVTHRFAAALSGTPGAAWIAASEDDLPGVASYGIALLSRYPSDSWQVLRLPRIPTR